MLKFLTYLPSVLIILGLTLIVGRPYLQAEFPYTHDGQNHLARFANYKIALKEGQVPPRYAPNLMNHYGYPVFNYNYPLANILSLPFSFFKINYEVTFKIQVLVSLFLGFWGVLRWLKVKTFSWSSRLIAVLVLATNPYLINTLYYRGNIGELLALGLLPWLLLMIERLTSQRLSWWMVVVMTAFLLAHNLAAIFGLPMILLYALLTWGRAPAPWLNFGQGLLWALGLSLWFWLPAIAEKQWVILGTGRLTNDAALHFSTVVQLFFGSFGFGFSYQGMVDSLNFWLGAAQLVVLVVSTVWLIKNAIVARRLSPELKFVGGVTLLCWSLVLFQVSVTKPMWQLASIIQYLQFPWRLSLFFATMILPLSAWVWTHGPRWVKGLLLVTLCGQLLVLTRLQPVDYTHKTIVDYDAYSESTSTANENLPLTFTYLNLGDWQPGPTILTGQGQLAVQAWSGSDRSYRLELTQPSTVVEPTMNFAGWRTYLTTEAGETRRAEYVNDETIQGRLAYRVEPGIYQVRTRFTQWTWPRIIGNTVFIMTALAFIAFFGYQNVTRYRHGQKRTA